MANLSQVKRIYCIAICGTGMGSLAGLLKGAGYQVSGSDAKTYPPMSDQLREQGIEVFEGYRAANIPEDVDLVIIGNAISQGHIEVEAIMQRGVPYLSMADALAEFFLTENSSIVVAGTHGKTTTAAMMSWLLTSLEQDPGFLVGGILNNFDRSWRYGQGPYFVIEGDEYDTAYFDKTPKFLHYKPCYGILNAVEFDHADIYADLAAVMEAFQSFVELIPSHGHLFACIDSDNVRQLIQQAACSVTTFGLSDDADYRLLGTATVDVQGQRHTEIIFTDPQGQEHRVVSPMPGKHNALNLIAVLACCFHLKVPTAKLQKTLSQFKGIKRRQEVRGVENQITVIDDFAHHPTAVKETLQALQQQYEGSWLWAIFEPRSNTSRRNIFQKEFAEALQVADQVVVAQPFDNGKVPKAELMNVEAVVAHIQQSGGEAVCFNNVTDIVEYVVAQSEPGDVIAVLSNGGFDGIHDKLLQGLAIRL